MSMLPEIHARRNTVLTEHVHEFKWACLPPIWKHWHLAGRYRKGTVGAAVGLNRGSCLWVTDGCSPGSSRVSSQPVWESSRGRSLSARPKLPGAAAGPARALPATERRTNPPAAAPGKRGGSARRGGSGGTLWLSTAPRKERGARWGSGSSPRQSVTGQDRAWSCARRGSGGLLGGISLQKGWLGWAAQGGGGGAFPEGV